MLKSSLSYRLPVPWTVYSELFPGYGWLTKKSQRSKLVLDLPVKANLV